MTFRKNFFGEQIAQPAATLADIENMIHDRHMPLSLKLTGARLTRDGDDDFKFGGELTFVMEREGDESVDDENDADAEPFEEDIEVSFDGHETYEDARNWLIGLGIKDYKIEEDR
jgi:hypothetical protein